MQNKKKDLPAMPFYIGDWKKDPAVQALSREEKMIWFEMIMLMWESEERGYLVFNCQPVAIDLLCNMLSISYDRLSALLQKFETLKLYSRDDRGAIFSRKIVKLLELSEKRANAGKVGAGLRWQNNSKVIANGMTNTENEYEYENTNEDLKKEGECKEGDSAANDIPKLWISTFGRNPKIPEIEETQKLIKRFGYDKTYSIFKDATLKGFKRLSTLIQALDDRGNIKPREDNGTNKPGNNPTSFRTGTDDPNEFNVIKAGVTS